MYRHTDVTLANTDLQLLPQRAVFWPEQCTLFVADTHFGKEATFRRNGIPVPRGCTDDTLSRLTSLITRVKAEHLVVLGDMFHARSSLSRDIRQSMEAFFRTHASIETTLVRGNHDSQTGRLPLSWPVKIVEPGHKLGAFELSHEPSCPTQGSALVLCGHIHPAVDVCISNEPLGRLPCFCMRNDCLVLPAFGQFTGMHRITQRRSDHVWIVADDEVIEYRA